MVLQSFKRLNDHGIPLNISENGISQFTAICPSLRPVRQTVIKSLLYYLMTDLLGRPFFHLDIISSEICYEPVHEYRRSEKRQDVRAVETQLFRELRSLAAVGLLDKLIPAPAVTARAEQDIDYRTQRQK